MIFIVLGAALLLAISVAVAWSLLRGEGRAAGPRPLPAAGLLGLEPPGLPGGADTWRAAPGDLPALAGDLLARLATTHRVVVAAPAEAAVPPVFGGPVFRAPSLAAEAAGDLFDQVAAAPGPPVVVLVLGPGGEEARVAIRDELPPDTPVLLVAAAAATPDEAAIRCRPADGGWQLDGPGGRGTLAAVAADGRLR